MMQTAASEKLDLRLYVWEDNQPPQMSGTDLGQNDSAGGVSLGMSSWLAPPQLGVMPVYHRAPF